MAELMVEARDLSKRIGERLILQGISLQVPRGQFVALLGPNGAGKSTLLRVLSLLSPPSAGTLRIAGQDPLEAGDSLRRRLALLSHNTFLYGDLSARENLYLYGRLYGVENLQARIVQVLERVHLTLFQMDPVRVFSRGMQQRLAIARILLLSPDLVFLDEPYTGLDLEAAASLNSILAELKAQGKTLFLITHSFEAGLELADQVAVLVRGRLVYQAPSSGWSVEQYRNVYLQKAGSVK